MIAKSSAVSATPYVSPVLTAEGDPGGVVATWTYSGPFPDGAKWQAIWFNHIGSGGLYIDLPNNRVDLRWAGLIVNQAGVRQAVRIRLVDSDGNQLDVSNWAYATRQGTPASTLISTPSQTVKAGSSGTVQVCFNLQSDIHEGTTYLKTRPGRTAVPAHSSISDNRIGVEVTAPPAGVSSPYDGACEGGLPWLFNGTCFF